MSMSRKEIAEDLKISVERVKQIEELALKKVKHRFLEIDSEENWVDILLNGKSGNSIYEVGSP